MRTPLSRVLHLGPAGSGAQHFWRMRLTAAASVLLVPAFVIIVLATIGRPHQEVVAILGSPLIAAILVLLIGTVTIHMRLGMQAVIEDYIHGETTKLLLLVASTFFCVAVAAVGVLAVLSLAIAS
ncbi:MAG: succinate dehydrogenase, hydrophobic membrane anchor protein [Alphaproteobacteria bacterium]